MAKSTSNKGKIQRPSIQAGSEVPLLERLKLSNRTLLRLFLIVACIGLVIYFFPNIVRTIGFGSILALFWLLFFTWVIWNKKIRNMFKWWNAVLGIFILSLAVWGILSLFHPQTTISYITSSINLDECSLGGNIGKWFIGNQGHGAPPTLRISILILSGIVITLPGPSFSFMKRLSLAAKILFGSLITVIKKKFPTLTVNLSNFYKNNFLYRLLFPSSKTASNIGNNDKAASLSTTVDELAIEKTVNEKVDYPSTTGIQLPLSTVSDVKDKQDFSKEKSQPAHTKKRQLPPLDLLEAPTATNFTDADNDKRARLIEESLASYGVEVKVVQINPGPSVTQFGVEPGWVRKYRRIPERDHQGKVKLDKDGNPVERMEEVSKTRVKVERITALSNNLALALATPNIRIEAPVPGKPIVGIEVPNITSSVVQIRGVIQSPAFQKIRSRSKLAIALGTGVAGEPLAADLTKMPHLLIAGTTGSGKTVCINSIITCLLMCNTPEDMRMMLIDPKRVELVSFNGVPHLITPVIVEVEDAINSLRRVIREMENRFSKFASVGVRNIEGYNKSQFVTEHMPYLIVIVDELADLMMTATEVVEPTICRLAQLSRATGIHLILATQRPSVDVVTGLIKANFPTRISFAVASLVDSRTILDFGGAEKLLGQGDMLYVPPDANKPKRLRGCFVSDQEIERLVKFWKNRYDIYPAYLEDAVAKAFSALETEDEKSEDHLMMSARQLVKEYSHLSTSLLQRKLHIGYPRAARIMDMLEEEGTIVRGSADSSETPDMDKEENE